MKPCKDGQHSLKVIMRRRYVEVESVVRWCAYCGAVVVDIDFDGQTNPGQMRAMEFPEITKLAAQMPT